VFEAARWVNSSLYGMGAAKTGSSAVLADGNFGFVAKKKFFLSGKTASMTKNRTDKIRKTISESEKKS
jgi:hypothetical protein